MYEVRWDYTDGTYRHSEFCTSEEAWKFFSILEEGDLIDSVGLYYTDGDGNEKELAVWCRK